MTREELIEILRDFDNYETLTYDTTADRILAALEKEREGEVVLHKFPDTSGAYSHVEVPREIFKKQGQLIFRPTPADKGGA